MRERTGIPDDSPDGAVERELLRRIAGGDIAAFELFYRRFHPRLFRFVLRTLRDPELVDEVIQDTLLLVWEEPHRFNDRSRVSTWVFGIAYYKAIKAASRASRRSSHVDIDELGDFIGDPMANLAERSEAADWLNKALEVLSPEQRAVIELTFHHGLAYEEIATIMDCPQNTVKTRMFHARKRLQAFAHAGEE